MSDLQLTAGYERRAAFNALAPLRNGAAHPDPKNGFLRTALASRVVMGVKLEDEDFADLLALQERQLTRTPAAAAAAAVEDDDSSSSSPAPVAPKLTPFAGYDAETETIADRLWEQPNKESRLAYFEALTQRERDNLMAPANLSVFESKARNYLIPLGGPEAYECLAELKRCGGYYLNMLHVYRTYCDVALAKIHAERRARRSARALEHAVTRREPRKITTKMATEIDVVSHVLGTDALRRFICAALASIGSADAVDVLRRLLEPRNAALLHPLVEQAHFVLVLCRGYIVDQALGLAPNTPSVADRETAAEIGALATQRSTALIAACADTVARLAEGGGASRQTRPLDWQRRVVPFEQLLAHRAILALSFGRCGVQERSAGGRASTQLVRTHAVALLSPTAHARAGYWRALASSAQMLGVAPSGSRPPEPGAVRAVEAPRYALLCDSLLEPRNLATMRTPLATESAVAEERRELVDTTALVEQQQQQQKQQQQSQPADENAMAEDEHRGEEKMSNGNAPRSRKRPAPSSAAATSVPLRRRGVNGQVLVSHRDVVVHSIDEELRVCFGKFAALVPNAATVAAIELLNKAYVTPKEFSLGLAVHGSKRTLLADKNRTGLIPAEYAPINAMAQVLSHLGDIEVEGEGVETLEWRLGDRTKPLSHYATFVLSARFWAEKYLSGDAPPLTAEDTVKLAQMHEYELLYGHWLTQIGLRLLRELGTDAIAAGWCNPPVSPLSDHAATLHGVTVSTSVNDQKGDYIVLGVNELPAQFQLLATPLLRRMLEKILTTYYRHIGLIDANNGKLIGDAAERLVPLSRAARFPPEQRELADYLTPQALLRGHNDEVRRTFTDLFLPLVKVLFPVTCYNRACKV